MEAIEITTFKLTGYTLKEFIEANAGIDEWMKKQPGFRSRHIFEQQNGMVSDILFWDNSKNGTDAMQQLMREFSDHIIHQMIDQQTVSWNITTVQHEISG
jgi:hypothetical protein